MSGRLAGKSAIVTGAGGGQGRAVALAYAAEGADVLAVDIDEQGLASLADDTERITTFVADVSQEADVDAAVRAAVQRTGRLTTVYNNAAVYLHGRGDGAAHQIEVADWERVMAINVGSVYLFVKHGVGPLATQGGSIINVASVGGLVASACHAYSASKGAVLSLTRSLAATYGPQGIRVNAIAPGFVDTPMTAPYAADPSVREHFLRRTPLRRLASADDVTGIAVFLASDESTHLSGTTIPVGGGLLAKR